MKMLNLGKKTAKCAKCGAEFEKGALSGETLCENCSLERLKEDKKRLSIQMQQKGIETYYKDMPKPFRKMPADIAEIMAERDRILEKYRRSDVISLEDFMTAYSHTGVWDEEECMAFMRRVTSALLTTDKRMSFAPGKFLVSHEYDGVVVDFDDVFAVAVIKGLKIWTTELENSYLCAMFTNNPHFPAIGMAVCPPVKKGFLSSQAKVDAEAVQMISDRFSLWWRHLTYPVMGIKDLEKLVKQEKSVRGNMSMEMMKTLLSCAEGCASPFWGIDSTMPPAMPFGISQHISGYGYLGVEALKENLMIDKQSERFWSHYADRCDREKAGENA